MSFPYRVFIGMHIKHFQLIRSPGFDNCLLYLLSRRMKLFILFCNRELAYKNKLFYMLNYWHSYFIIRNSLVLSSGNHYYLLLKYIKCIDRSVRT